MPDHLRRRAVRASRGLGAAALVAVAIGAPGTVAAQSTPQPSLSGNVTPRFPAAPAGRVAVVGSGVPYQGVLAFVVQNGTPAAVNRLRVSATVRASDGSVAGRGSTKTLVPAALRPNDIAIGSVRLRGQPPPDARYELTVSSRRLRRSASSPVLTVTNTALSSPTVGSVAQQLTGTISNTGKHRVRGPILALALCTDEAGHPVLTASSTVAPRGLRAGAGTPVTISFPALCPAYLVGARPR